MILRGRSRSPQENKNNGNSKTSVVSSTPNNNPPSSQSSSSSSSSASPTSAASSSSSSFLPLSGQQQQQQNQSVRTLNLGTSSASGLKLHHHPSSSLSKHEKKSHNHHPHVPVFSQHPKEEEEEDFDDDNNNNNFGSSPLRNVVLVKRIMRFAGTSVERLATLSLVHSSWKETSICYSDEIWFDVVTSYSKAKRYELFKSLCIWGKSLSFVLQIILEASSKNNNNNNKNANCSGGYDNFTRDVGLLVDKQNWTLLHRAAQNGLTDTVHVLIELANADPFAVTESGWTPLYFAILNGHFQTAQILVKAMANRLATTKTKQQQQEPSSSPLPSPVHYYTLIQQQNCYMHVACSRALTEDTFRIMRLLLEKQYAHIFMIDLNSRGSKQYKDKTPLEYLIEDVLIELSSRSSKNNNNNNNHNTNNRSFNRHGEETLLYRAVDLLLHNGVDVFGHDNNAAAVMKLKREAEHQEPELCALVARVMEAHSLTSGGQNRKVIEASVPKTQAEKKLIEKKIMEEADFLRGLK